MITLDTALNYAPEKIRNIHIMGICGTGMAALAGMLQAAGFTISGSDSHVYPPMSDFLHQLGITIYDGYNAENLATKPDLVIVGNVITRKNPEAAALAESALPYLSFPQALSHFFIRSCISLVVAGTHGKTTTCSLLANCLYKTEETKFDPTFMIGGIVKEFAANFRLGSGDYFIAEGDEYDTAFFDKESKFLHYRPQIAIITSIEFDHADIFDDLEQIKAAFRKFVRLIPEDGLLVANLDCPNVAEIAAEAKCEVQGYGLYRKENPYYWMLGSQQTKDGATSFQIYRQGKLWHTTEVKMTGRHNCLNSLAVTAVLHKIGLSPSQINKGLSTFAGVKRRQEVRGEVDKITVIDDFAHHPTAVRETLAALKAGYPGRRLVTVFEPRTNSSRRAIFQKDYISVFDYADMVLLREPIPIDGLAKEELFSSKQLAEDLQQRGQTAQAFADTTAILDYLQHNSAQGDVIAILSNGGFDNIHERLLKRLESRSK